LPIDKERPKVGVDRIVEEGIWGIEEEVYKRTSAASARLR